jgi:hypothetical protein
MPRKKKIDSQPVVEEKKTGVFISLSEEHMRKLELLAKQDHNCTIELHAQKILTHYLANMNFYFTR